MSSKTLIPSLIHVPHLFSTVERGLYRSASPTPPQIPFLSTLNLKTIISLTPEHPTKPLISFIRGRGINFLHFGVTLWRVNDGWKPIRDEIVKATLEVILDVRNHPVLLIDPLGIHQTGIIVGCLRTMMGWNFASTLVEYRSHSGPTKHRANDEQYIELFDPDLINLPPDEFVPVWYETSYEDEEEGHPSPAADGRLTDGSVSGVGSGRGKVDVAGLEAETRDMRPSTAGVG